MPGGVEVLRRDHDLEGGRQLGDGCENPVSLAYGKCPSRQEVVLPVARAEYRITEKQPVFSTNLAAEQWALIRLKPGKNDRNLPINANSGWGWGGATFRQGPDPKYRVALEGGAGPDGATRIKPKEPLAPGEYGLIAIIRGQPNMVEVFEFGVD